MNLPHHGIAGGDHVAPERVDGETVTGEPLGKDRIGYVLEGDDDARDGGEQGEHRATGGRREGGLRHQRHVAVGVGAGWNRRSKRSRMEGGC